MWSGQPNEGTIVAAIVATVVAAVVSSDSTNEEVQRLGEQIIEAQLVETAEMAQMLEQFG